MKVIHRSNIQFSILMFTVKQHISFIRKLTLTVESHDEDTRRFAHMDNCEIASSCARDVFTVRPYSKLYTYLCTTTCNVILSKEDISTKTKQINDNLF